MMSLKLRFWPLVLTLLMWRQTLATGTDDNVYSVPRAREASSPGQMAAIMDRLTSLDNSMAELKEQMAQLLRSSSGPSAQQPSQVLQDLQGLCNDLSASGAARQTDGPGGPEEVTMETPLGQAHKCPDSPPSNQLRLTAAMLEETETAFVVTVCYSSPEKPQVFKQSELNSQSEPIEHDELGVVTVRINKSEDGTEAHLSLGFQLQSQYYVHVSFQLLENSTEAEFRFPDMQMTVEPGNNVIYNTGSDVDLIFNVKEADENGTDQKYLRLTLDLKSTTEQNLVNRYMMAPGMELPAALSGIQFTQTDHHSAENEKTLLLHMPYSPEREGGLVAAHMFSVMKCESHYRQCFVQYVSVIQNVAFYPRNQPGPFPENFVGFVRRNLPNGEYEADSEAVECYEGNRVRNCFLYCMAIGDDPTITLSRVGSAPTSPYSQSGLDNSQYFASAFWEIKNPVKGDEGEYQCQAESRDGGHVITQKLTVTVYRVARIIRSLTNATAFPNGSLSAVCTAEGDPLPTVRFAPFSDSDGNSFIQDADVIVTQINETTSQATLFSANWKKYDRYEVEHDFYCKAENVPNDYDYEPLFADLGELE